MISYLINMNNIKLKEEYTKLKQHFELKCKNYFIKVSKPFLKYLKSYFKLILINKISFSTKITKNSLF